MIRACENSNEQCPIYHRAPPEQLAATQEHGCFSDSDHRVSLSTLNDPNINFAGYGRTILVKYIYSEVNQEQVCRADHEAKNQLEAETGDQYYSLPSLEVMVHALEQHHRESGRNMPRALRKAIKEYQIATDDKQLIRRAEAEVKRARAA